ncbi:slit homolog 2 protein-like isoform X2 [Ostrea edulis]|uniref:slit homolog 2 protein-like isoform X2 n=1 Tax=Ostrea edulis TaxID=37623 RepID=UPI0024AF398A|nr:slit homolog 2 protein-like isoform X2 [Ostrea edulis]
MQLVVWALIVFSVFYSQGAGACPDQCNCTDAHFCDGTFVDCRHSQLTEVPTNIPSDTCDLHLWGNNITTLPNRIFDALKKLMRLSLSSNKITTLPIGIFDALTSLQKLNLYDNEITTLPTGTFDTLTSLQTLYLSDNKLTTLHTGTFDQLGNLQILDVSGNPLHCDCHLVAFIRFMKTRRLQLTPFSWSTEASCQNPLNLKETLLKDISLQEVFCDSGNTKAQTYTIDLTSANSIVNPGDNYTSLCKISDQGTLDIITNLKVKWYHNSKLLTSQCTLKDVSMAEKYSCEVLPPQHNSISLELTVMGNMLVGNAYDLMVCPDSKSLIM